MKAGDNETTKESILVQVNLCIDQLVYSSRYN